jgi:hypothetical protein
MSADVRSIAELREWHAALTTYRSGLLEALSSVDMEIRRAFDWLSEMISLWQRRAKDAEDDVVQAKAELAQRKFPMWDGRMPDTTVQEENLRKAKAKLQYCDEQVVICRKWHAKLPKMIEETYEGASRRLLNALEIDLPNGMSLLNRRVAALEAYADLRADYAPPPSEAMLPSSPPAAEKPADSTPAAGQ